MVGVTGSSPVRSTMKLYFIIFLLHGVLLSANAQQNIIVTYGEIYPVISFPKQRNIEEYNRKHYLYTNNDSVAFCSFNMQKPDKKSNTIGKKKDHHAVFIFPRLRRILAENHWTKPYNLTEVLSTSFNWQINTDTSKIAGYTCRAAVSDGIVAWFTEDIALPYGPALYYGLPGLILMIEDHRYKRIYKAVSIEKGSPKIVLPDLPLKACMDCDSKLEDIRIFFKS